MNFPGVTRKKKKLNLWICMKQDEIRQLFVLRLNSFDEHTYYRVALIICSMILNLGWVTFLIDNENAVYVCLPSCKHFMLIGELIHRYGKVNSIFESKGASSLKNAVKTEYNMSCTKKLIS